MTRSCAAILVSLAASWGCKDQYVSPYKAPVTGYLVVEGYISGNSTTEFTLSRTVPLPGTTPLPAETGANVEVDGSDGSVYPLSDRGNGVYSDSNALPLTTTMHYQLRIKTTNGEQYLSDTVPYKPTPPIDSLNWVQNPDNSIHIYVNTHDPTNNTRYYQWNWDQTFEYHSAEESLYYYDKKRDSVILRSLDTGQVYRCWLSASSSNILVNSSLKLAQDEIYRQPVNSIPPNDVQSSVLYTILVRQYAITQDGYNFLSLMQQNTESLGSIFDAQPSAVKGNIHCLSNPGEEVIGYISAGTVQQQRLWISREQIFSTFEYQCAGSDIIVPMDKNQYRVYFGSVYSPITEILSPAGLVWEANYTDCLVCTTHGGTNHAPSYWPN